MQKYKKLIIGSFLVLAIVLAPVLSFAKNEESKTNDNNRDKIEIKNELKSEIEKGSSNSIWNRILRFFNSPANAMTQVNLNLAPSISGISAPTILEVGETGTWKIKASDPQNGTLDYSVDWGEVTSQAFAKSTTSAFVQTATFTHAYPNAGTYNITFTVTNNAGLKTTSKVSVLIKGEKVYPAAPRITKLEGPSRVAVGTEETIVVKAEDPNNGTLTYSANWGDLNVLAKSAVVQSIFTQTATFSHVYTSPGTYMATFTVENEAGLKDTRSMRITVTTLKNDVIAPIISRVRVNAGSADGTISWITDEKATSQVFYSLNTPLDMNSSVTKSVSKDSLNIKHALDLPDLTSNTIYYFVIKTVDASGNVKISPEYRFMTTF